MRTEKKYLVDEISDHIEKSDHLLIADYHGIDTEQTFELRSTLSQFGAEFHVVKNRLLNVVLKGKGKADVSEHLVCQNAIISGGDDVSQIVKSIKKFEKSHEKLNLKVGFLGDKLLTKEELSILADLPSLDELRGQLVGLLSQPARGLVTVMVAAQKDLLGVLNAKVAK